jgi:hypothetical protein
MRADGFAHALHKTGWPACIEKGGFAQPPPRASLGHFGDMGQGEHGGPSSDW